MSNTKSNVCQSEHLTTTHPGYTGSGSNLILEVKRIGELHWSKLNDFGPLSHVGLEGLNEAVKTRDQWASTGPKEIQSAQFRIGRYEHIAGGDYVWVGEEALRHQFASTK